MKALQWQVDALNNGWVSPGSVTLDDGPALERFTAARRRSRISAAPGNLPEANDPKASSIAGDAEAALVPGETGPGGSFGLQEGFGIPITAENKDAREGVHRLDARSPRTRSSSTRAPASCPAARPPSTSSRRAATSRAAT